MYLPVSTNYKNATAAMLLDLSDDRIHYAAENQVSRVWNVSYDLCSLASAVGTQRAPLLLSVRL